MLCLAFEICCLLLSNCQRKPGSTWEACEQGVWGWGSAAGCCAGALTPGVSLSSFCLGCRGALRPAHPCSCADRLNYVVSSFYISCPHLPEGWCPVFFMGSVSQLLSFLGRVHSQPTRTPLLQTSTQTSTLCLGLRSTPEDGATQTFCRGLILQRVCGRDVQKSYCRACCVSRRNRNRQGWRRTCLACP